MSAIDPKVAARARRRVKAVADRLEKTAPLFVAAGIERAPTLEEAAAQVQAKDDEMAAHLDSIWSRQQENERRGLQIREALAAAVPPERMEVLDAERATLPRFDFGFSFWHKKLREEPRELCQECRPLIDEVHAAERPMFIRSGMLVENVMQRVFKARREWLAHALQAHQLGPQRFQRRDGCSICRGCAEILDMRERDEPLGFAFPGALATARDNYEKHMQEHARRDAEASQCTPPEAQPAPGTTITG